RSAWSSSTLKSWASASSASAFSSASCTTLLELGEPGRILALERTDLLEQRGKPGDVVVALQQHGQRTGVPDGQPQQIEHRITDGRAVRIDDQFGIPPGGRVPGDVNLHDALERQAQDEGAGVETVVERVDVNVVDIQEQTGAALPQDF